MLRKHRYKLHFVLQHCCNEYDDHLYSDREKREKEEYEHKYDGVTMSTRSPDGLMN